MGNADDTEALGSRAGPDATQFLARDPGATQRLEAEAGRTFGPYTVVDVLGRGGFGQVYLARRGEGGERVALKVVRARDGGLVGAIRREIHALSRLAHPGVVCIVDHGVEEGLPWYAMELIVGQTLRALAFGPRAASATTDPNWWTTGSAVAHEVPPRGEEADAGSLALAEKLEIARGLCEVLAYIHGEGIVHRDLKPENVLVRPGLVPAIVDFGLVERRETDGRETIDGPGEAGGTLAYMAPEQAMGGAVDARADLFALGCILYELLTGQLPFAVDTPARFFLHRMTPPKPPSALVPALPGDLDDLVLGLLQQDARRRTGHADDVVGALARLGAARPIFPDAPRTRPYLYRAGFVGRDSVIERMDELLGDAAQGRGGMVLLEGGRGIGKTRMAAEVGTIAWRRGIRVLAGGCGGGPDGDATLGALTGAFRAIADDAHGQDRAPLRETLRPHAPVLAAYETAFAPIAGGASLEVLPPRESHDRLWRTMTAVVLAISSDAPVLLLIDDLHAADALTAGFLRSLQRGGRLARSRIAVVATFAREEPTAAIQELGETGAERLVLPPFGETGVAEIVKEMLAATHAPRRLLSALVPQVDGNPFLIAEYLRIAIDDGLLTRDRRGRWRVSVARGDALRDLPLPKSLRRWVRHLLEGLDPEARRLLQVASVMGRSIDRPAIAAELGAAPDVVDGIVADLVRRHVLEDGPGGLRFGHDGLLSVVYESVPEVDRPRLHALAAARLAGDAAGREAELARHHELAGDRDAARDSYLAAARGARRRFDLEEASRLYGAFLALVPSPTRESVATRAELIQDVLLYLGRPDAMVASAEALLADARVLGTAPTIVEAFIVLALAYVTAERREDAWDAYGAAQALNQGTGDKTTETHLLRKMGSLLSESGRFAEAEELLTRALASDADIGAAARAVTLQNLAGVLIGTRRLSDAGVRLEEALAEARAAGKRRLEVSLLVSLGTLHTLDGRSSEACAMLERGIAEARQIGDLKQEGLALANLASQRTGEECREMLLEAIQIFRETGDARMAAEVATNLATELHGDGRLEEARRAYLEAGEMHRRSRNELREADTLVLLGKVERDRGDLDGARALMERGKAIFDRRGHPPGRAAAMTALGSVERYASRLELASQLLRDAERLLSGIEDRAAFARCLVEQGHVALARGDNAATVIARLDALDLADRSGAEALAELREAAAAVPGLLCGELPSRVPEGLRRALLA